MLKMDIATVNANVNIIVRLDIAHSANVLYCETCKVIVVYDDDVRNGICVKCNKGFCSEHEHLFRCISCVEHTCYDCVSEAERGSDVLCGKCG